MPLTNTEVDAAVPFGAGEQPDRALTNAALKELIVDIAAKAITVQDEGVSLATSADTLNFVGAGVSATGAGATKTITIAGGGDVATDAIWDAAGDLAVGSGANTAARLAIGAEGTYLGVVGGVLAYSTPSGSGDVTKVGTPLNNQMPVWTGDGTLEGTSDFTYDGTSLNLVTGKNFQIAGGTVLSDAAGTLTLSGIDALDPTTEATVEAAIDTLANLSSVQGLAVTLADAGEDAVFGWDDSAGAYQNLTAADARSALTLASVELTGATNLVRGTHGNRLVILNSASPFTVTIEDDTTGGWGDSDGMTFVNIGAGTVTIDDDGTSVVTAVPGYALTIPQNGVGGAQRNGTNAWGAYGQPAVQAQATWEAGAGTSETVISPAKLAAAITALSGASPPIQQEWLFQISGGGTSWSSAYGMASIQGTVAAVTTPFDTSYGAPRGRMTATDAVVNSGVATARGVIAAGGNVSGGYMPGSVDSQRIIYEGLFMPTDTAAGRRWAVGLYLNNAGNPSASADPDAWTNVAIFAKRAADSNIQFITNSATSTGTATDLGANFPAAAADAIYFVRITERGGATPTIDYYIKHLKTGNEAENSVTADLPVAASEQTGIMWTSNGPTTATAATFEASYQRIKLQYQGL